MTWIKCFIVLFFFAVTSCAVSQPVVKTYAWEQDVIPGAIPVFGTEENGGGTVGTKPFSTNYFIYLSHQQKTTVQPTAVWINGTCYRFTIDTVKNTPVTKVIPNNPTKPTTVTLVPKIAQPVLQLKILAQPDTTCMLTDLQKKKVTTAGVVVGYQWKGKLYFTAAAPLQRIQPALHQ